MKPLVERWLKEAPHIAGVLALGVQFADKSCASRSWTDALAVDGLDAAWRCVADVFPVLKLNRLPAARLRWIYERALLYCERREDGLWLGVLTARDSQGVDMEGLARLLEGFHRLGVEDVEREK